MIICTFCDMFRELTWIVIKGKTLYKNHFRILGPSISNVVQGGKIQFPANIGWHRFPVTVFQYSELPIRKIIIGHRKPRKGNFKVTSPPQECEATRRCCFNHEQISEVDQTAAPSGTRGANFLVCPSHFKLDLH